MKIILIYNFIHLFQLFISEFSIKDIFQHIYLLINKEKIKNKRKRKWFKLILISNNYSNPDLILKKKKINLIKDKIQLINCNLKNITSNKCHIDWITSVSDNLISASIGKSINIWYFFSNYTTY